MLSLFNSSRVWILTLFELTRLFASKRGLIVLSAFSCVWFLIFYYVIGSAAEYISSENFKDIVKQGFGRFNLLNLLEWNVPELSIYWIVSAYILPFFTLMFSCDQTCSDRERGTLRFILLRSSRAELLFGRFLGQLFIVFILTTITLAASLLFALINQQTVVLSSIILSLNVLLKLIVISMPFIASMSLINIFVKSAKMSLVIYFLIYLGTAIVITVTSNFVTDISFLFYILPGEQIESIIGFEGNSFDNYIIPLLQTTVYLFLAQYFFKRAAI